LDHNCNKPDLYIQEIIEISFNPYPEANTSCLGISKENNNQQVLYSVSKD